MMTGLIENRTKVGVPRSLSATQIVAALARLEGWTLCGDGPDIAIGKTFRFAHFHDTMAFVNAVAFVAHRLNHHPDLSVHFDRCEVRWRTHDTKGLTALDFDAAARVDALLADVPAGAGA